MRDIIGRLAPLGKEKGEGEPLWPAFFELNNTSPGAPSNQSLWLRLHLLKLQQ